MQLSEDIAKDVQPEEDGDGNEPSRAMESVVVVKRAPITSVVMKRVPFPTPSRKQNPLCTGLLIFALGRSVCTRWDAEGHLMSLKTLHLLVSACYHKQFVDVLTPGLLLICRS